MEASAGRERREYRSIGLKIGRSYGMFPKEDTYLYNALIKFIVWMRILKVCSPRLPPPPLFFLFTRTRRHTTYDPGPSIENILIPTILNGCLSYSSLWSLCACLFPIHHITHHRRYKIYYFIKCTQPLHLSYAPLYF
jgi:hypothetical protein